MGAAGASEGAGGPATKAVSFLVFGDIHGKVLPAFRLAMAWSRDMGTRIAGLLQVGDLGYFPDSTRLDRATARFAAEDPLELGVQLVTEPSPEADAVFLDGGPEVPACLWFTAGNHEDFQALRDCERTDGPAASGGSFVVDAYGKVRCIGNGAVEEIDGGPRVGALWGIEGSAKAMRKHPPPERCISPRRANQLACSALDVLLTHDGPPDAILAGTGSPAVLEVIRGAEPSFAFFGHYGRRGGEVAGAFGRTRVFHLGEFSMLAGGGRAEWGSVGVLRWRDGDGEFEFLPDQWLRGFTRDVAMP